MVIATLDLSPFLCNKFLPLGTPVANKSLMNPILPLPSALRLLVLSAALLLLAGCGANTEGASSATPASGAAPNTAQTKAQTEPTRLASVATAFTPALGSGGNGAVMTELKSHGGQLREPDAKYDVFDTESTADLKALKQTIRASLDRNHSVLIDSDGTPESREKAGRMSYEAIGASIPSASAVLIRNAPEEEGGGFMLTPIYSKADVAEQIAQGQIGAPEEQTNSAENFFFEPRQKQP